MKYVRHTHLTIKAMALSSLGLIGTSLLMGWPAPAWSHSDAYLDTLKTPHGGQLRMAGPLHIELVLAEDGRGPDPITVYVTDHAGTPQSTRGAQGKVSWQSGHDTVSAPLEPAGGNKLAGGARHAPRRGMKAIVSITMPGQAAVQANFTPSATRH